MSDKKSVSIRIKAETKSMLDEISVRRGQSITTALDRAVLLAYREMLEGRDSISAEPRGKPSGRKKR